MKRMVLLGAAWLGLIAAPVEAQFLGVALEPRLDLAVPHGQFAEEVEAGVGVSIGASVRVVGNLGVYGGFTRTQFDRTGPTGHIIDQGFVIGASVIYPQLSPQLQPWVGAGVLFHDLHVRDPDVATGGSNTGFEAGLGLAIPLTQRIRLTPAAVYRRYAATYLGRVDSPVSYFTLGVGANFAF